MHTSRNLETIGIAYNLKPPGASSDQYEEYDELATIEALEAAIASFGLKTARLPHDGTFFERIRTQAIDLVLNIAEGIGSGRGRESQVPCMLESLGIAYTGSDPIALGITLDKYLTWLRLSAAGVPVPMMHMVSGPDELAQLKDIFRQAKAYIVKPRWEGSSKGVFLNSLVTDVNQAVSRIQQVFDMYRQPAVIEEFLEKDEITAAIYGNGEPKLLGMMKIGFRRQSQEQFIYSLEVKRDWKEKVVYVAQRDIPQPLQQRVAESALKAYSALELRDIARIDFRLDGHDIPRVIDVNPLPGLSPHYSDLPILYRLNGGTYSDLIALILAQACQRLGFPWKPKASSGLLCKKCLPNQ